MGCRSDCPSHGDASGCCWQVDTVTPVLVGAALPKRDVSFYSDLTSNWGTHSLSQLLAGTPSCPAHPRPWEAALTHAAQTPTTQARLGASDGGRTRCGNVPERRHHGAGVGGVITHLPAVGAWTQHLRATRSTHRPPSSGAHHTHSGHLARWALTAALRAHGRRCRPLPWWASRPSPAPRLHPPVWFEAASREREGHWLVPWSVGGGRTSGSILPGPL